MTSLDHTPDTTDPLDPESFTSPMDALLVIGSVFNIDIESVGWRDLPRAIRQQLIEARPTTDAAYACGAARNIRLQHIIDGIAQVFGLGYAPREQLPDLIRAARDEAQDRIEAAHRTAYTAEQATVALAAEVAAAAGFRDGAADALDIVGDAASIAGEIAGERGLEFLQGAIHATRSIHDQSVDRTRS